MTSSAKLRTGYVRDVTYRWHQYHLLHAVLSTIGSPPNDGFVGTHVVVSRRPFQVTLSQREELPFTEAFICEVLRILSTITTSVPNRPVKATTFRGYRIPKHFNTLANIESVHMDPVAHPEPKTFNPERFLDSSGKFKRVDQFMPFDIGECDFSCALRSIRT